MSILQIRQVILRVLCSVLFTLTLQTFAAPLDAQALEFLIPDDQNSTLAEVQYSEKWQPSENGWLKEDFTEFNFWFAETPKVAWLKIDLSQKSASENNPYLIELASSGLSHAKLFYYLDGHWQTLDSELLLRDISENKLATGLFRSRFITFEAKNEWRKTPIYLRVNFTTKRHLQVNILLENELVADQLITEAFFFFCYGILFVMVFYNFVIGRYLQDKLYYCYSLAILSTLLYQVFAHGHGRLFGYFDWDQVNHLLNFLAMMSALTALIFLYHFSYLKRYAPKLGKYFRIYLYLFGFTTFFVLVLPTNAALNIALLSAGPAPMIAMLVSLWVWYRGSKAAGAFVFAWSFYIVGGFLWVLYWMGMVPLSNSVEFPLVVGAALEAILLSLALGFRIQLMKEQRSALTQSEKYYKEISALDPMTKLANRRAFDQRLQTLLNEGITFNLVLLDIDHFKTYNDNYGHLAGDKVIKKIANILQKTIRDEDMAARIGGEEFALILLNEKVEVARSIAERVRLLFSDTPFIFDDQNVYCTVSIGIAIVEPNESADDLIERADKALYRAKNKGRNQTQMSVDVMAS